MNDAVDIRLDQDTIAAIATAPGRAGIGIVRLSGSQALRIGQAITNKRLLPRSAVFCQFKKQDGASVDGGVVIYFSAPHSFTGEDVVEFQAHGNPIVLDQLVNLALYHGARLARAGEFSERAFLNGKIDLAQAEAIADLVSATTESAARSAQASLQGVFSREIAHLIDRLVALRVYIEAAMDFPEEAVDFLSSGKIREQLDDLETQLKKIMGEAQQGSLLAEGMTLVIVGKPNAGKSSLLNALAGRESAIVTSIPGTTRDLLREHIQLDGMPLLVIDTAGLRESQDPVEQEGIRRAVKEASSADRILLVVDSSDPGQHNLHIESIWAEKVLAFPKNIPVTTIFNKCDLVGALPSKNTNAVTLSAKTTAGLDFLKQHLKEVAGYQDANTGRFSARRRHLQALKKSADHIAEGKKQLFSQSAAELLAEELRLAQQELEVITGRFTPDDLLDRIFRDFCIGK